MFAFAVFFFDFSVGLCDLFSACEVDMENVWLYLKEFMLKLHVVYSLPSRTKFYNSEEVATFSQILKSLARNNTIFAQCSPLNFGGVVYHLCTSWFLEMLLDYNHALSGVLLLEVQIGEHSYFLHLVQVSSLYLYLDPARSWGRSICTM